MASKQKEREEQQAEREEAELESINWDLRHDAYDDIQYLSHSFIHKGDPPIPDDTPNDWESGDDYFSRAVKAAWLEVTDLVIQDNAGYEDIGLTDPDHFESYYNNFVGSDDDGESQLALAMSLARSFMLLILNLDDEDQSPYGEGHINENRLARVIWNRCRRGGGREYDVCSDISPPVWKILYEILGDLNVPTFEFR